MCKAGFSVILLQNDYQITALGLEMHQISLVFGLEMLKKLLVFGLEMIKNM